MFPDEESEWYCLMCGERIYGGHDVFIERLLEAVERRMLRDGRAHGRRTHAACAGPRSPALVKDPVPPQDSPPPGSGAL
jgi:hypothetical protein